MVNGVEISKEFRWRRIRFAFDQHLAGGGLAEQCMEGAGETLLDADQGTTVRFIIALPRSIAGIGRELANAFGNVDQTFGKRQLAAQRLNPAEVVIEYC